MTRTCISSSAIMLIGLSLSMWNSAGAQEATPTNQPPAELEPAPTVETPPAPPAWTYQKQTQNRQGSVTNTHRYSAAPEEGRYVREHVVNNPRGEMTQTWERTNTDQGYRYSRSQTWTRPDGTPLRQHEQSVSGTDPYNYTREHSLTLPDGRTINQTQVRSWDGTNGTMERTFSGPNGQTRESQRSWTPHDQTGEQALSTTRQVQPSGVLPPTTPTTSDPTNKPRWWQKLNPFRRSGGETARTESESVPRRGFTIGAARGNAAGASSFRSGEQPSVQASEGAHRPWWAGESSRSMRTQGPPPKASEVSTASRPNPGRGNNR